MPQSLQLALRGDALDGMTVLSARITEAISRPTRATVRVTAPADVDPEALLESPAHLEIAVDGAPVRQFHLVVVGVQIEDVEHNGAPTLALDLAHELALLELRSDVGMFQNKDAQEIVAAVLDGAGVAADHVSFSIHRALAKRTYCVQYRETDLAFISRLLEHEGVFYFAHDDASSTHVTFADAASAFSPIAGDPSVRLIGDSAEAVGIHELSVESVITAAKATVSDYNFETPSLDLIASATSSSGPGERFEYTAGHKTPAEGEALSRLRIEELLASETIVRGVSTRMELQAGAWFELENTARSELAKAYLVTSVEHEIVVHGEGPSYENHFACIDKALAYRPARWTPRPTLRGLHSAVVTGPPGSEIHTDKHGRMKGHFFWDRVGASDDTSSCWMRVAQLPIGGSMALARVGWEMAIAYVDGDPDRPVAVARLYTAEKVSPYGYPAAKTRMSLQTPSSPASGKSNELRMEDGGGGMELFVNASKDFDGQTNNNKKEVIGVDEKLTVGVNAEVGVGVNETVSIGGNRTATLSTDEGLGVGANRTKSVGGSETVTVSGGIATSVTGSDTETTGGSHTTLAALGVTKSASGGQTLTVAGSLVSAAGAGVAVAIAGAKSETIGAAKIAISGATVSESVVGALASTVGGVLVQAASGNRDAATKGTAAITVGGLMTATAGSKVMIKAKKVTIRVAGIANLLGGGGILNMTPGSTSFVGLVTLDASGKITISGNPNLAG